MKKLNKLFIWFLLFSVIVVSFLISKDILKLKTAIIAHKLTSDDVDMLVKQLSTYFVLLSVIAITYGVLHLFNMLANKFDLSESFGLKKKIENQQIVDTMITQNEVEKQLEETYDNLKSDIVGYFKKNTGVDSNGLLSILAEKLNLVQAEIYLKKGLTGEKIHLAFNYAFYNPEGKVMEFEIGEGLVGQVVKNGLPLNLDNVPDGYVTVISGLGKTTPQNLLIIPIAYTDNYIGVLEFASFAKFSKSLETTMLEIGKMYGEYLVANNIVSQE